MEIGGQDHFYLEGQIAMALPGEDDEVMVVYSSTQHPSEIQHMVAKVLGRALRRGDGRGAAHGRRFRRQGDPGQSSPRWPRAGGQASPAGRQAAPDRDDDMIITGKRHDFLVDYEVGFDDEGAIARRST